MAILDNPQPLCSLWSRGLLAPVQPPGFPDLKQRKNTLDYSARHGWPCLSLAELHALNCLDLLALNSVFSCMLALNMATESIREQVLVSTRRRAFRPRF